MQAPRHQTPPELIFPPQVPFGWTRRWAFVDELKVERDAPRPISNRIVGSAHDARRLAAAIAFCNEHGATLELG
jgi:hypothetical protein